MSTQKVKTRIQLKHATEADWNKATSFVPLAGELIIYDKDSTTTYERFKVGDGTTVVTSLPFANVNAFDAKGAAASALSTARGEIDAVEADLAAHKATHAPSNAQKNQNAFSNIAVSGQTTVAADTATDTVTFVGSGITITTDATNDKVTFTANSSSTSQKGIVQLSDAVNSTSTTLAGTANAVKKAYDAATTAQAEAASKIGSVSLASGTNNGTLKLTVNGTATDNIAVTGLGSAAYTESASYATAGHEHNYAGSSSKGGAATSANKVNSSLTVKLNGGTTENTNLFTFNGSTAKSINITPSAIGAAASSHGTHVSYGTSATAVGATASAGSASTVSRSDHTHSLSKSAVTTALGYTPPTTNTTYSAATTSADGLMSAADKAKLDASNVAYGTCATAAATAAKAITLSGNDNWKLTVGAIIMVSFTNSNTAESVTLNVNNTGAYPIWYNNAEYTSTGSAYTGYADRVTTYMFNGTHWVWVSNSYDANTQSNTNSTNTDKKIFLVGATAQGSNKTTYSHDTVYAGTDGHVYSNSKQVVNLSDSQALTNKTYNGYTLGAACAKGVDTTATSGSANLITSGAMYTALSGKAASSHGNHVPATETANNAKFLRNDNTWATVTPANIGAAASSHTHDYAASSHAHGNITSSGTITSTAVTAATGLLVYDSNNKIQRATAANVRSIIGAGTSSLAIGTTSTTAAAGNHTHSGYAGSSHAHGNITSSGTITSTAVTSATGLLVYDSSNKIQRATAANVRSIIGAGTSNLTIGTTSTTAAAGNHTHSGYAASGHTHSDYMTATPAQLEFKGTTSSSGHGGYIDFHYNGSTADYTSRIIEGSSGTLTLNGMAVNSSMATLSTSNTTEPCFRVKNSLHDGWLCASSSGRLGLWSETKQKWIIMCDEEGKPRIPNTFYFGSPGTNTSYITAAGAGQFSSVMTSGVGIQPLTTKVGTCGASQKLWSTVYAATAAINTSDRKEKKDITEISEDQRYLELFDKLIPVSYKFIDGTSGRTHVGFISQDVEEAMTEVGLSDLEFAGFCRDKRTTEKITIDEETGEEIKEEVEVLDEDGNPVYNYSLRYAEFIALNTQMIQILRKENKELKNKLAALEERLAALENK